MPPATVAALIDAADAPLGLRAGHRDHARGQSFLGRGGALRRPRRAGVNRVSLGVQSLDDAALNFLGRAHDVDEALMALGTAQSVFARVSFDLIYALPGQSDAAWQAELRRGAVASAPAISRSTSSPSSPARASPRWRRSGELVPADPDDAADALRADPGDDRGRRPPRLRNLQPRPARRGEPAQPRPTGATALMPGSAPARMAGAAASRPSATGSRRTGSPPSPATATASPRRRRSRPPIRARRRC